MNLGKLTVFSRGVTDDGGNASGPVGSPQYSLVEYCRLFARRGTAFASRLGMFGTLSPRDSSDCCLRAVSPWQTGSS